MANLELKNKINVPFADKGNKINVPDTSAVGSVNMTDGFGSKYDTPIAEGGEYIYREEMNDILHKVYAAVKELQDLAITAGFPVDMTKALNVLSIANGGTGANNAEQARSNLGLGSLAAKSTITSADIANGTIVNDDIANNTITTDKIANGAVQLNSKVSGYLSRSNIAQMSQVRVVHPLTRELSANVGDVFVGYSESGNNLKQYLPNGGGWSTISLVFNGDGHVDEHLVQAGLYAGGGSLDTNSIFNFIYIIEKTA